MNKFSHKSLGERDIINQSWTILKGKLTSAKYCTGFLHSKEELFAFAKATPISMIRLDFDSWWNSAISYFPIKSKLCVILGESYCSKLDNAISPTLQTIWHITTFVFGSHFKYSKLILSAMTLIPWSLVRLSLNESKYTFHSRERFIQMP